MSTQCRLITIPIAELGPAWVEFTGTKGVLRVLKPADARQRSQGLVFTCPRCRHDKNRAHFCIFLFENAPEGARPHGRFKPSVNADNLPEDFAELSLWMLGEAIRTDWLKPGDLKCRWEGHLNRGAVSWRPGPLERWLRKL